MRPRPSNARGNFRKPSSTIRTPSKPYFSDSYSQDDSSDDLVIVPTPASPGNHTNLVSESSDDYYYSDSEDNKPTQIQRHVVVPSPHQPPANRTPMVRRGSGRPIPRGRPIPKSRPTPTKVNSQEKPVQEPAKPPEPPSKIEDEESYSGYSGEGEKIDNDISGHEIQQQQLIDNPSPQIQEKSQVHQMQPPQIPEQDIQQQQQIPQQNTQEQIPQQNIQQPQTPQQNESQPVQQNAPQQVAVGVSNNVPANPPTDAAKQRKNSTSEQEETFQIVYEQKNFQTLWKRHIQMTKNDFLVFRCESCKTKQYGKIHVICTKAPVELNSPYYVGMIIRHQSGTRFTLYGKGGDVGIPQPQLAGISFIEYKENSSIRMFRVAIPVKGQTYTSADKHGDLSRIAHRGDEVPNVKIFCTTCPTKKEDGTLTLYFGPYSIIKSTKNFVIADENKVNVFTIFKTFGGICTLKLKPPFTPLIGFAIAVAISTSTK